MTKKSARHGALNATATARVRKLRAEAQIKELELAAMQGRLIDRTEALGAVERMLTGLRSALLTLPQRWAPTLVGHKTIGAATAVLEPAVHELLATLSGPRLP